MNLISNETKLANLLGTFGTMATKLNKLGAALHAENDARSEHIKALAVANDTGRQAAERAYRAASKIGALVE